MLAILLELLVVLQSAVVGDGAGAPAAVPSAGAPAAQAAQAGPPGYFNIIFIVGMFAVMYFLMIRPQQKRAKETEEMLKSLKKGALVRTTGGIRGEIFDINDRDAVLIIADKVKINVLRAHIAGPETVPSVAPAADKA